MNYGFDSEFFINAVINGHVLNLSVFYTACMPSPDMTPVIASSAALGEMADTLTSAVAVFTLDESERESEDAPEKMAA